MLEKRIDRNRPREKMEYEPEVTEKIPKFNVKFLPRVWAWLDGKKFYIGSTIAVIGGLIAEVEPVWGNVAKVAGGLIAGGGALDKVKKGVKVGSTPKEKTVEILKQFNPNKIWEKKMNFELLLPLVMEVANKALDAIVKGESATPLQIKMIQSGYNEALIWGRDAVNSTATTIDDAILASFFDLCEDTAIEGGFPLSISK